jgi:hypothetical protein
VYTQERKGPESSSLRQSNCRKNTGVAHQLDSAVKEGRLSRNGALQIKKWSEYQISTLCSIANSQTLGASLFFARVNSD